jgi:hypothetical protein
VVIHLVNWNYDAARDAVAPARDVRLDLDLDSLGLKPGARAKLFAPGAAPTPLRLEGRKVTLPELGLWAMVAVSDP